MKRTFILILIIKFLPLTLNAQPWNLSYRDYMGITITVTIDPSLNDLGHAKFYNGYPVILLGPMFSNLAWQVSYFTYFHELGHHVLGHLYGKGSNREFEADCWAIKFLFNNGYFTNQNDIDIAMTAYVNTPGDWTHAPGPIRIDYINKCARGFL